MNELPRLLLTMGDVAGVGPEIIARAWPALLSFCQPLVVGDPDWMGRGLRIVADTAPVSVVHVSTYYPKNSETIPVLPATREDLTRVQVGKVSAAAGKAAYDFLCTAVDLTLAGEADGIVTLPIHKEGLHRAGLHYPGHTEILAERTGVKEYGMMLYCREIGSQRGLGIVHVTLHCALRDVFAQLSSDAVLQKIHLLNSILPHLLKRPPRIGVAGLNPHASDGGLFGDEEQRIIEPAIQLAQSQGIDVSGPWPADTLFVRIQNGEMDGIVAMYHDQGHIPMKLLARFHAVNITLGLPIVRTSVAHGTAYDIAGQGIASASGLIEAALVAAQLCCNRNVQKSAALTRSG